MNRSAPNIRTDNGDIRPLRCQWKHIQLDQLAIDCPNPADAGQGITICFDHARVIGYSVGLDKPERVERTIRDRRAKERDQLRKENHRLQLRLAEYASTTPAPEPATTRPTVTDGTIYFLRSGGHIKIGWTADLTTRMKKYPPDTQLLATMPGTRKDEAALHKKYAHHRTHGREWYPLATQITEHIQHITAKHGAPDPVHFAARPTQTPRPHANKPRITPRGWTGKRSA